MYTYAYIHIFYGWIYVLYSIFHKDCHIFGGLKMWWSLFNSEGRCNPCPQNTWCMSLTKLRNCFPQLAGLYSYQNCGAFQCQDTWWVDTSQKNRGLINVCLGSIAFSAIKVAMLSIALINFHLVKATVSFVIQGCVSINEHKCFSFKMSIK